MTSDYLELRTPEGESRRVPLSASVVVGRAGDADLVLDNPGVSRRHAAITRDSRRWIVRDLGSRNGTSVNGALVQEQTLGHGDTIGIADYVLTLNLRSAGDAPLGRTTGFGRFETSSALRTDTLTVNSLREMGSPKVDMRHLVVLHRFGRRLLEIADAEERLALLCRLMLDAAMPGRYAAVVRLQSDGNRPPQLMYGPEAGQPSHTEFYLSQTVLNAMIQRREPVLAGHVAEQNDVLELSVAQPGDPISVIACPLRHLDAGLFDLLYVVVPTAYGTAEWLALAAMAAEQHAQAEEAWTARRRAEEAVALERDLARARQVQMGLLPKSLDVPGFDITLHYEPCRGVGGDYVDVIAMNDGRVLCAVADVCGKGIQAALISASLHTFVHAAAASGAPLGEWMSRLNGYLRGSLQPGSFVTMAAVAADPATGELTLVNAGHPPTILLDAGGRPRLLPVADNLPLGIEEQTIAVHHDTLGPGETVALYTDGLTEIVLDGGSWLGSDGLAEELATLHRGLTPAGCTARGLADGLADRARQLLQGHDPEDDQTFLLARRLG